MVYPDYQSVENPNIRDLFQEFWGKPLDPKRGLTVVEIINAIHAGQIKGMYIEGENPAMSDPDAHHARQALAMLDHLVVQDIFLTETAFHADVVLPASAFPEKDGTFTNTNRQVQMGRAALPLPGNTRQDWWIIQEIANRLGCGWNYTHPSEVFTEMAQVMPSLKNITWERVEREDSVTYPSDRPDQPGNEIIFATGFPTASGRGKVVPARIVPPDELPDAQYPMVLSTGRVLEHWHTGAMTRRASALDEIEPEATAMMSPMDIEAKGFRAGQMIRVATRRGAIDIKLRSDRDVPTGMIFIPFCYAEAAANILTNPALDPFGKIPEFKFCAAKVEASPISAVAAE
jgi:formate dehydrogenase major subunit